MHLVASHPSTLTFNLGYLSKDATSKYGLKKLLILTVLENEGVVHMFSLAPFLLFFAETYLKNATNQCL